MARTPFQEEVASVCTHFCNGDDEGADGRGGAHDGDFTGRNRTDAAYVDRVSQWQRFHRCHQIGCGGFGTVFLCHDMLPGSAWYRKPVAVKVVPLHQLSDNEIVLAMNEVAILRHLCHANILQYIDSFIDEERQLCLVSEYMGGGDLASLLRRTLEDSEEGTPSAPRQQDDAHTGSERSRPHAWIESYRVADVVRQSLEALSYLHSCYIIHRDIKPANVYMTEGGVVQLGDFGVSKLVSPTDPMARTFIGTPFYLSPELCLGEPYSFGADIWALGVLTYEMYCMKLPFGADNVLAQIHVVTEGEYDRNALYRSHIFSPRQQKEMEAHYGSVFAEQEEVLHHLVVELVERMLVVDPLQRPSAEQLLRDFFIGNPSRTPSQAGDRPHSWASTAHSSCRGNRLHELSDGSSHLMAPISFSSVAGGTGEGESLANRVNLSYEAFAEMISPEMMVDVLQIASRPASSGGVALPTSPSNGDGGVGAGVDMMNMSLTIDSVMREVISETVEKVPWLRDAEAFSSLSLQEGYDDDVVRVDWINNEQFSLVRRHEGAALFLKKHSGSDAAGVLLASEQRAPGVGYDAVDKKDDGKSISSTVETITETTTATTTAVVAAPICHSTSSKLLPGSHDSLGASVDGSTERQPQQQPASVVVGRCQGLSTETLEAILRKKIMASHVSRQWRLKELREAYAAQEEKKKRMRAELNDLYANSFNGFFQMLDHQSEAEADESTQKVLTVTTPRELLVTQRPSPLEVVMRTDESVFNQSTAFGQTINRLAAHTCRPETSCHTMNSAFLSAEVVRVAMDAAAVAARRAELALHPPTRLEFSRRDEDTVDDGTSSSLEDLERGANMEVYDIPVTLRIVHSEAHVGRCSILPMENPVAGSLALPICIALRPVRYRTRLDGIVWRVKEALRAYGLDHALFFPLDMDNADEVGAEELRLRYIDRAEDVIAISEPSDWFYTKQDWRRRMEVSWMQLYMVMVER